MSPVAAPSIADRKYALVEVDLPAIIRFGPGRVVLSADRLKPVPAPGCTHWNTCIQRRKG